MMKYRHVESGRGRKLGRRVAAIAATLALVAAACGGDEGSEGSEPAPDAESSESVDSTENSGGSESTTDGTDEGSEPDSTFTPDGKLVVWTHTVATADPHYEAAFAEYAEEFGVEVELLAIPLADMQTKLVTALGSGNPPDVIKWGGWQLPGFIDKGQLAPVNFAALGVADRAGLESRYEPNAFDALTFDGEIYGLPTDYNAVFMYYNKNRFAAAGLDPEKPPTTWEEVAEFSEALTNEDGTEVGFHPPSPGSDIWAALTLTPLVEGLGGSILNADGTAGNLNTPEGIQALEYYAGIGNPDLTGLGSGFALFRDGVAAMQLGGPWVIPFVEGGSEGAMMYGEDVEVILMPGWEGMDAPSSAYTWSWSVPNDSDNQATAWHFINYMNSEDEINGQIEAIGTASPILNWADLPAAQSNPGYAVMNAQFADIAFVPSTPYWSQIMLELADTLDAVWFGQKAADEAAADFDEAVADIVGS